MGKLVTFSVFSSNRKRKHQFNEIQAKRAQGLQQTQMLCTRVVYNNKAMLPANGFVLRERVPYSNS